MSGPKYYNYTIGDDRLAREIIAHMRAISGVQIRVENGVIKTVVSNDAWYGGIHYDTLERMIREVRESLNNGEEFKTEKARRIKAEEKRAKSFAAQVAQNQAAIESARNRANAKLHSIAPIKGKYVQVDVTSSLRKEAEKSLGEIEDMSKTIVQQQRRCMDASARYLGQLKATENMADLSAVSDSSLPTIGKYYPEQIAEKLEQKVEAKENKARAFVSKADELVDKATSLGLGDYLPEILQLVRSADPFGANPFKETEEFIKKTLEECQAAVQTAKRNQEGAAVRENVAYGLQELAKVSARLNVAMQAVYEQDDKPSVLKSNGALAKQALDLQAKIAQADYISPANNEKLKQYASSLKNVCSNLGLASAGNEIKKIMSYTQALSEKVEEEDRRHALFAGAYEEFNKARESLTGDKVAIQDVFFNPVRYEEQIRDMKEKTAQINDALKQRQVLATSSALMSQIGEERIASKKMTKDGVRFTYVHPENPGVLFDAQADYDKPMAIYPRGVILSNGKKTVGKEELKKTHSSCGWSNEMTESLQSIGLPKIESQEIGDAVTESMYDESQYYRIETEEESIALLKKWGYSDEEIASKWGYVQRRVEPVRTHIEKPTHQTNTRTVDGKK